MVNQITTTKLQTLGIIGHSNAFGLSGSIEMFAELPFLLPARILEPNKMYWDNIFVATSAHGYAGAGMTPPTHAIEEVAWLELTTNNPASPAAAHPHASPYAYPNNAGVPYPNWLYDAGFNAAIDRGTGTCAGIEIPLMHRLSSYWADQIGLIKMAAPGSKFLRFDLGLDTSLWLTPSHISSPGDPFYESLVDPSYGYYNWYTPLDTYDWDPSTGRFYDLFIRKCVASRDALPTGTTMAMDNVVVWMGDNDAPLSGDRITYWEDHVRAFIARLRKDLSDNRISSLPPHQIHIIWMGVLEFYNGIHEGHHTAMNEAVQRVMADDPYMSYVETNDYSVMEEDPGHLDASAYIQAADDVFEAILANDVGPYDGMDTTELLTVAQMKDRVRLHYSRGNVQTDLKDNVLLLHLNGAMHHLIHQCGDNAYWLRRRTLLTLNGGGTATPVTMPRFVHRLLEIEDLSDATYPLYFQSVGHTAGGKLQVVIKEAISGAYNVQYIRLPRDLSREEELVPVPSNLVEWLVAECCLRLARAASNPLHVAAWSAEVQRLQMDVLKNISQTNRSRRDAMFGVRRLPDVLRRRRRF